MRVLPINAVNGVLLQQPGYWNVLSVCREISPMTLLCKRHCQISCDDLLIKDFDDPYYGPLIKEGRYRPPERKQVEEALEFARQVGTGSLIIHCAQGLSRSPA